MEGTRDPGISFARSASDGRAVAAPCGSAGATAFALAGLSLLAAALIVATPLPASAQDARSDVFVAQTHEDDAGNAITLEGRFDLPLATVFQTGGDNAITVRRDMDDPCEGCTVTALQRGSGNLMDLTQRSGPGSVIDARSIGDGNVVRIRQR